jgi:hypothetical protein
MGADGLRDATGAAVLAANYLAARLREHFPVLYSGENGLVAHECILDLRPLTEATGVTVDDVAKRLIDYGFHAPTMSFPVPGTLMVEPTESEDLAELERFVEAMVAIKAEADAIAAGEWPADDNPLHNAPHTARSVIVGEWEHAYPREKAVYPVAGLLRSKYWPPVRRGHGPAYRNQPGRGLDTRPADATRPAKQDTSRDGRYSTGEAGHIPRRALLDRRVRRPHNQLNVAAAQGYPTKMAASITKWAMTSGSTRPVRE